METAISSPRRAWRRALVLALLATALGLVAAGCGSAASPAHTTAARASTAFGWVRPAAPAPGWGVARISVGASVAYPPGWRAIHSDAGTASRVLTGPGDRITGYLNLTPRTANERLADWARFRVAHNGEEDDHDVRALASAQGLRFASARGSCVRDSYTTKTAARYVEIACLVIGHRSGVVVIAAARRQDWARMAPALERAVSSTRA